MRKTLKYFLFIFLFMAGLIDALAQNPYLPPKDSGYVLVFHDEFDSVYSQAPLKIVDPNKWARIPGWHQGTNHTDSVTRCGSSTPFWDKAYIIENEADSSTVRVNNGTCKLLTNQSPNFPGEVWQWPECDSIPDTTLTGYPCRTEDSCRIHLGDTQYKCWVTPIINFQYTTGMLYSKDVFKYGYFEIRFKIPHVSPGNQGFGPNFWLWGADTAAPVPNWWSEIDIYEIIAYNNHSPYSDRNKYTTTVHYSNCNCGWNHPAKGTEFTDSITGNTWHKAAAWWTPNFIKFYFDDIEYFTVPKSAAIPVDSLAPMPIFVDINSPGPGRCNNFDSVNTVFPYTYEIDYVRVYQLKDHCMTDTLYCTTDKTDFQNGLYHRLTIGDTSCNANFADTANITGVGSDFVLLQEGLTVDSTSKAYFDVQPCSIHYKQSAPPVPQPPLKSWLKKSQDSNQ